MLDIAEELHRWVAQGREFAVATVVAVGGSAPRQPGAALAVDADGTAIGSVSGGCVEAAVYELCRQALQDGTSVVESFGYSDEDAYAVGLTCGGVIDILVTPVPARAPLRETVAAALADATTGRAAALARIVAGPGELVGRGLLVRPDGSYQGGFGAGEDLDRTAAAQARALLDAGRTGTVHVWPPAGGAAAQSADGSGDERAGTAVSCTDPLTVFVESSAPPPRMIVFGAVDFTAALVRAGTFLGYRVTVCDARPVFATRARFPEADEVVVEWPHTYLASTPVDGRTVLCVLTHDAKFDIPLLQLALRLPVAYVGAMGSRRTHDDRTKRLRDVGVGDLELARLRSPIGLDLGSRTPEETAVSIAAEIIAQRRGGSGVPLTGARMPIHHDVGEVAGGPDGTDGSDASKAPAGLEGLGGSGATAGGRIGSAA